MNLNTSKEDAEALLDVYSQRVRAKQLADGLQRDPINQLAHLTDAVLEEMRDENIQHSGEVMDALYSAGHRLLKLTSSSEKRSPLRMLVVEDDFSSRVLLQGLLSKYGECHIAVNGKEAVQAFISAHKSDLPYDFICMDIQMPELNGQQAVEQIRALEAAHDVYAGTVKIFMTTGLHDPKDVVSSFDALCDAYLVKPIDQWKLEEILVSFGLSS